MLIPTQSLFLLFQNRTSRRNVATLAKIIGVLVALVLVYSILFHLLMLYEGQSYSWITGIYWSMTVMSTLGFGDITFSSDLGLFFTIIVLASGVFFMMIILPFTFIQFFYTPWLELKEKNMTPRELPVYTCGHVIVAGLDPVTTKLIAQLQKKEIAYVVVASDLKQALELRDRGYNVVVGAPDDPALYRKLRVQNAAMVVATIDDLINTNISFTIREVDEHVPIVTNAENAYSVDILQFSGNIHVFQFMKMLGESLAERVLGVKKTLSIIATYDELCIGVVSAAGTSLVGKRLAESRLRENIGVTVVGIWEKGRMLFLPSAVIAISSIVILAGSAAQFQAFNEAYVEKNEQGPQERPVLILGGGRVGQVVAKRLEDVGFPYKIVEKRENAVRSGEHVIIGNAADLAILKKAGLEYARSVVITTHDDDMNIYLAFYCRQLRPDIQIISRAKRERNVSTLYRAGADLVMSYANMGAGAILNVLLPGEISVFTDGLVVFNTQVPEGIAGMAIAGCGIREKTGCSIVALRRKGDLCVGPSPHHILNPGEEIILVGSPEEEKMFRKLAGQW